MIARTTVAAAALALFSSFSPGDAHARPRKPKGHEGQNPNACAHVEARPVYGDGGFSHVVSVRNTCTQVVKCKVWTNVDKGKTATLDVPAHAQREATLQKGSPVSLFRAEGQCAFNGERE